MRTGVWALLSLGLTGTPLSAVPPPLRYPPGWLRERLGQMLACDEAYLYNEVRGGRAIHQNSFSQLLRLWS